MSEYIKRQDAVEAAWQILNGLGYSEKHNDRLVDEVDAVFDEAVEENVRPVVIGKWEDVEVTYVADKTTLPFERIFSMRCNQCNRYHTEIYYYGNPTEMAHFCPNCGADMRGEQDV